MSIQIVYSGSTATLSTDGSTDYLCAYGNRITANNSYQMHSPAAGVISELRVALSGAPGAGKSYTFTVYKNGVATSLTVTISGTDTVGVDTSHTVSISATDNLDIRVVAAGTPTARYPYICLTWTPTTTDYTIMCGTTDTSQLPTSGTVYVPICGCVNQPYTSAADARLYMPIAGTFRDLYVELGTEPGAGAKDRIFTFRKNGAGTTLGVTISGTDTNGSDTTDTVTVAKGDYVELLARVAIGGGPAPAASYLSFGVVFIPDVEDYFLVGNTGDDTLPTTTGTEYAQVATGTTAWNSSTTAQWTTTARVEICKMTCHLGTLPSSGTWTIQTTRTNGPSLTFGTASSQTQQADAPVVMQNTEDVNPELWAMVCGASGVGASLSTLSTCFALRAVSPPPPWMF